MHLTADTLKAQHSIVWTLPPHVSLRCETIARYRGLIRSRRTQYRVIKKDPICTH